MTHWMTRVDGSVYESRFERPFARMAVGDWFDAWIMDAIPLRSYVSRNFRGVVTAKAGTDGYVRFTRIG